MPSPAADSAAAVASSSGAATVDIPIPAIPSNFWESFRAWWSSNERTSKEAEERVLSRIPFYRASPPTTLPPTPELLAIPHRTTIPHPTHPNRHAQINALSLGAHPPPSPSAERPPTLLLHGYLAGLAFFMCNLEDLGRAAHARNGRLWAFDWLGMGRSERVAFPGISAKLPVEERVRRAEDFFVDSLEEWRKAQGIKAFVLAGHSLGGYLSLAYALRHPTRVLKLILISPVGIPQGPSPEELAAQRVATEAALTSREPRLRRMLRKSAIWLWEQNVSPLTVLRASLFFGPLLVSSYSTRRFTELPLEDQRDLHHYIYSISSARGSGEYCLSHILSPGAYARQPMVDRIAGIKCPVTFMYGDRDWMDVDGGHEAVRRLREAGNTSAKVHVVPDAGHHIYLDNATDFNRLMRREMEDVPERAPEGKEEADVGA